MKILAAKQLERGALLRSGEYTYTVTAEDLWPDHPRVLDIIVRRWNSLESIHVDARSIKSFELAS